MIYLYLVIVFLLIALLGHLKYSGQRSALLSKINFMNDYFNTFNNYLESRGKRSLYNKLIFDSHKVQNHLGSYGICPLYKPPFANFQINNYPIILNMLPELHKELNDHMLGSDGRHYANAITDTFNRYMGVISNNLTNLDREIKNPMDCLRTGIERLLQAPVHILYDFKILPKGWFNNIEKSAIYTSVAGLLAIFTIIDKFLIKWSDILNFFD